jgi:hypothetical protein
MKATRAWFEMELAVYGTTATRNNGRDIFGSDDYPWVHAPPVLPGQVWATPGGAILVTATNPAERRVAWGGTLRGYAVTAMPDLPAHDDGCLVYGPRAPWCSQSVWNAVETT